MNTKVIIVFNDADGTVYLSNSKGIIPIAKIKNNVVSLNALNRETALIVGLLMQHLGTDIQRLVETA